MATEKRIVVNGISLRRDAEAKYLLVADRFIPKKGEVCLVDTEFYGLRAKIGDGFTSFANLEYTDENNNVILVGYYFNGNFYTDSTYTVELEKGEHYIYKNKNESGSLYIWNGSAYEAVTPYATETVAGLMKLYQSAGQNEDGTMSQKVITEGVNAIKFELDEQDKECLVLDLPWD